MERKRVIESLLALMFIIFLIILILLFIGIPSTGKSTTIISHSYNTYNIGTTPQYISKPINHYPIKKYTKDNKYYWDDKWYYKDKYLEYSHNSEHEEIEGIFGSEINRYTIYVKNRAYKGGYFTVEFYLYDYYGKKTTKTITHYLDSRESESFLYQTIYGDNYYRWNYKVISKTRY